MISLVPRTAASLQPRRTFHSQVFFLLLPSPWCIKSASTKMHTCHIIPLLEALQGVPAPCSVNSRLLLLLPTRLSCLPTLQVCSPFSVAVF